MSKLKGHWESIANNSTVWRGQIDYLLEEWKRFVELREELLEWMRKAETYLESNETVYGYTVSELEDQMDKHKVSNLALNRVLLCGKALVKDRPIV